MRVLYLNHTSRISGAERFVLDLLGLLPDTVTPFVACPRGELADRVRALGIVVLETRGLNASLRPHPMYTSRAVVDLLADGLSLRRLARLIGADLIHANSVRAGLAGVVARRLGGPPLLVHLHDVLPPARIARLANRVVGHGADGVIANSDYTAKDFSSAAQTRLPKVVYYPVIVREHLPRLSRDEARSAAELPESHVPLVGIVAQITPWKGQDRAVQLFQRVRGLHPQCRLLIIGDVTFDAPSTRFDNVAYEASLHALAARLGVADAVDFLGQREDVDVLLRALDVVLMPSTAEPFGRAMVEAMGAGTVVIATDVGGPREVIDDGRDGILLPPDDVERWSTAVSGLLSDAATRRRMGEAARQKILNRFDPAQQTTAFLGAYRELVQHAKVRPAPTRRP